MPQYIRTDQAQVTVEVPGVALDKESWDTLTGGDNVAEEASVFPGGMKPLVQLGGFPKRSALTVSRPWADSLVGLYKGLDAAVGRARVTVAYQNLNTNREAVYTPFTYSGILTSVKRPDYKAGTSEAGHLEIVVSPDGEVG